MELEPGLGEVESAMWALVFVTFQFTVTRRAILEDVPFDFLVAVAGDDDAQDEHANEHQHKQARPAEQTTQRTLLVGDRIVHHLGAGVGSRVHRRHVDVIGYQTHGRLARLRLKGA